MEDKVQSLVGPDGLSMPFYLLHTYYDVILRGENSWLFEEIGFNKLFSLLEFTFFSETA